GTWQEERETGRREDEPAWREEVPIARVAEIRAARHPGGAEVRESREPEHGRRRLEPPPRQDRDRESGQEQRETERSNEKMLLREIPPVLARQEIRDAIAVRADLFAHQLAEGAKQVETAAQACEEQRQECERDRRAKHVTQCGAPTRRIAQREHRDECERRQEHGARQVQPQGEKRRER